jgi:predicted nuclease of restriction endonuclease-like RecB superfamily
VTIFVATILLFWFPPLVLFSRAIAEAIVAVFEADAGKLYGSLRANNAQISYAVGEKVNRIVQDLIGHPTRQPEQLFLDALEVLQYLRQNGLV